MLSPSLFDFRQLKYTFPRKPGAILKCARLMLGVSQIDVLRSLKIAGITISISRYKTIEGDLDGQNIGAIEWWNLCECLGISSDIYDLGYSSRFHITKVFGD